MVEHVAVDAHVVHELGHISTLPGEDHLSGGVVNTDDRGTYLIASSHRLAGPSIDVLARAEGDPSAVVPESELRTVTAGPTPTNSDMRSGGQRRREELLTLPCRSLGWPQRRRKQRLRPEAMDRKTRIARKLVHDHQRTVRRLASRGLEIYLPM